jgi:hypothetical protein
MSHLNIYLLELAMVVRCCEQWGMAMAGGVSVAEVATQVQNVDNAIPPHFVPARHFFRMLLCDRRLAQQFNGCEIRNTWNPLYLN